MKAPERLPSPPRLPPTAMGEGAAVRELDFAAFGAGTAPFQASELTVEPGCTTDLDCHRVRECWLIVAGEGLLTYEGAQFPVRPRDVIYFDSDKAHQLHNTGRETLVAFSIWWPA